MAFLLISAELVTVISGSHKCATASWVQLNSKHTCKTILDFVPMSKHSTCVNQLVTFLNTVVIGTQQMKTYTDFWLSKEKSSQALLYMWYWAGIWLLDIVSWSIAVYSILHFIWPYYNCLTSSIHQGFLLTSFKPLIIYHYCLQGIAVNFLTAEIISSNSATSSCYFFNELRNRTINLC